MNLNIKGKCAIVTGGGTGIGKGISLSLGQAEVNVVVCGRRAQPLSEVVQEIEASGDLVVKVTIDTVLFPHGAKRTGEKWTPTREPRSQ